MSTETTRITSSTTTEWLAFACRLSATVVGISAIFYCRDVELMRLAFAYFLWMAPFANWLRCRK